MKKNLLFLFSVAFLFSADIKAQTYPFLDPSKHIEDRLDDAISRLTLEEKILQLQHDAPAIPRLGIPSYNWWNEALHGVARNGKATVFPQAIGMAATFNEDLIYKVANAISDEARAKYNAAVERDIRAQYAGLTFWSPNINIFRDPRWGRGQETYGEDPYLSGLLGSAFVRGLQGDHPDYLKTAACAKHYAVHSGPEELRHSFDAIPSRRDFRETYLPAFERLVKESEVEAVMCAYNRVYGEPCCGSPELLQEILREEWGFKGHLVSDCGALKDFHRGHMVTKDVVESAALALESGINVNCGGTYAKGLEEAVTTGKVSEAQVDATLKDLWRTRFKLGLFDPPGSNPFDNISPEVVNSPEHRSLSREAARQSMVLLKNNGILPLNRNLNSIAVVGPHAASADILLANYYGVTANAVTVLEGVTEKVGIGTKVFYKYGVRPYQDNKNPVDWVTGSAMSLDAVVAVMGISGLMEGEEGESIASAYKGDRSQLELPQNQVEFLKTLRSRGDTPIILVVTGGSPIALTEVEDLVDAILWVWYPGEEGGTAVADLIFGQESPSGRLPITFPKSLDQLPDYEDYTMAGRTYRYMEKEPLYPFGYGLSYTSFEYGSIKADQSTLGENGTASVAVKVTNTGSMGAEEVVQLYASWPDAGDKAPLYDLKGIQRVYLAPGQSKTVQFEVEATALQLFDDNGNAYLPEGKVKLIASGAVPTKRSAALGISAPASTEIMLKK
ncbi:MAG: glycoside hydrolase family 3 C-terminal domain-containing protein [Mameliella sp.]|nr:glycoside hydrolase family 3 C-terminal domain-containing protein [Phaeodactylibacter sp.]